MWNLSVEPSFAHDWKGSTCSLHLADATRSKWSLSLLFDEKACRHVALKIVTQASTCYDENKKLSCAPWLNIKSYSALRSWYQKLACAPVLIVKSCPTPLSWYQTLAPAPVHIKSYPASLSGYKKLSCAPVLTVLGPCLDIKSHPAPLSWDKCEI